MDIGDQIEEMVRKEVFNSVYYKQYNVVYKSLYYPLTELIWDQYEFRLK